MDIYSENALVTCYAGKIMPERGIAMGKDSPAVAEQYCQRLAKMFGLA